MGDPSEIRHPIRRCLALALMSAIAVTSAGVALAAPGARDTTFGGDGKVTTNPTGSVDGAAGVAIQADGRIVAAGASASRFALIRYTVHGALDPTFGGDGKVFTDFAPGRYDSASAVVIQPDGKIVAAGIAASRRSHRHQRFGLVRYRANGTRDPSFGDNGKVATSFTGGYDGATDLAIQPDGKIVAVGYADSTAWAIARYDTDGNLDPTFGDAGKVTTTITGAGDDAWGVAIQADGKIVVSGTAGGAFAVARYDTDGTLDPTFSTDGTVSMDLTAGYDSANAVAIQTNQEIVAVGKAGNCCEDTGSIVVVRFDTDGALDASFGTGGTVTTELTPYDESAGDVAVQPDDRIVVVGRGGYSGNGSNGYFVVARYDDTGTLDPTFSHDGIVTTEFGKGNDAAAAVAIQGNGKIVAAGVANADVDPRFALSRYLG